MTMKQTVSWWREDELAFLADHMSWTIADLADVLGRPESSVQQRRLQIKNGWAPKRSGWTDEDLDIIRSTAHLSVREVTEITGRSRSAIKSVRVRLAAAEGHIWGTENDRNPFHVGLRPLVAKTCGVCGEVRDRKWFPRAQKAGPGQRGVASGWQTVCKACRRGRPRSEAEKANNRESARRASWSLRAFQQLTLPARNNGNPWTETDHVTLRNPQLTILEKALHLGRSYGATWNALSRGGYTSRKGLGNPADEVWIIANPNAPEQVAS